VKRARYKTVQLGALVVAAFDNAARYSTDSRTVTHLATRALMHILQRARSTESTSTTALVLKPAHDDPFTPFEADVIEPADIVRAALQNASTAAALMIATAAPIDVRPKC
jgi:chaperonin GroEL (HSP60 family)